MLVKYAHQHNLYKKMNLSSFSFLGPYEQKNTQNRNILGKSDSLENDDSFNIVILLDESGSMDDIKTEIIKSLNNFIKEQKQVKSEKQCKFSLIKFNHNINRIVQNKKIEEVTLLMPEDYNPNGRTALYDAIGSTIDRYKNMKDLLMVIVTDGEENASTDYKSHEINSMIENKKKYDGWTYVYLSNDLKTQKQGNNIGITKSACATNAVRKTADFGNYISKDLNNAVSNQRMYGMSAQSQLNR
jgi:uncharacterized protein YegL